MWEAAEKALHVIESALGFYPDEENLLGSRAVLLELIASIKVSSWIEKADMAALLADVSFYKVSHHGSHNATPKSAVEKLTAKAFAAMVSAAGGVLDTRRSVLYDTGLDAGRWGCSSVG